MVLRPVARPIQNYLGVQWLSGRVLDLRPRGAGSSLTGVTEQDTFILD